MAELRDFLGNEWHARCIGCGIGDRSIKVPGGLLLETEGFCVHQDPAVPLPGFLVIGARRHIRSVAEMGSAEYQEFAGLLQATVAAVKTATEIESLTVVQEERSAHFHLWLFPWTAEVVASYGEPSLSRIRTIMSDYRARELTDDEWAKLERTIREIAVALAQSSAAKRAYAE